MPENGVSNSGGHRRTFPSLIFPTLQVPNFFTRYEVFSASASPQLTPSASTSPSPQPISSPSSSSASATSTEVNMSPTLVNPFSRRDEFSRQSILMYKITTLLSYVLLLVTTVYYSLHKPHEKDEDGHTIWGQNGRHPSPFAQNSVITSIYWLILFILQLGYAFSLYTSNSVYVTAAANIGSHYVANNLLLFGFIHLWVRSHFWLAEILLVINFFNLSFAYFRHSTTPRLIHIATVSGPLAWNFVALYWCGAVMVHAHHLAARIVANIFIWGILAYGLFFLAAFKDYTMGFELSILSFSTAVGQFLTKLPILQLQWIFAFVIGGLLFLLSLAVGVPGLLGRDPFKRGEIVSEDRERAPLLADD